MKLNEKSLCKFANSGAPPDKEGYLHKRGDLHKSFQKRWFVLKGNLLFYYEKRTDKEPIGVIVLEGCTIELADNTDGFTFFINFTGPASRKYTISADSQEEMEAWMKMLSCASYDYMRLMVSELEQQLADLNNYSQRDLVNKAKRDSDRFQSQFPFVTGSDQNKNKFATRPERTNPFDDDDSVMSPIISGVTEDESSTDQSCFPFKEGRKARTFLEMHEDFGKDIKELSVLYLNRKSMASAT